MDSLEPVLNEVFYVRTDDKSSPFVRSLESDGLAGSPVLSSIRDGSAVRYHLKIYLPEGEGTPKIRDDTWRRKYTKILLLFVNSRVTYK